MKFTDGDDAIVMAGRRAFGGRGSKPRWNVRRGDGDGPWEGPQSCDMSESGKPGGAGDDRFLSGLRLDGDMPRSLTAQTLGSTAVPASLVLAELAVRALDAFPGSPTAWYVSLAVFAPLEQVRAVPSPLAGLLGHTALTELLLLLLLPIVVHRARFRLGVALLAHLSFAASVIVCRAWILDLDGAVTPRLLLTRESGGTCLVVVLIAASGIACALCHLSFLSEIFRPTPADRGGAGYGAEGAWAAASAA